MIYIGNTVSTPPDFEFYMVTFSWPGSTDLEGPAYYSGLALVCSVQLDK